MHKKKIFRIGPRGPFYCVYLRAAAGATVIVSPVNYIFLPCNLALFLDNMSCLSLIAERSFGSVLQVYSSDTLLLTLGELVPDYSCPKMNSIPFRISAI